MKYPSILALALTIGLATPVFANNFTDPGLMRARDAEMMRAREEMRRQPVPYEYYGPEHAHPRAVPAEMRVERNRARHQVNREAREQYDPRFR